MSTYPNQFARIGISDEAVLSRLNECFSTIFFDPENGFYHPHDIQGLTKETFFSDYARFDWLMSVYRFIEAGKEGRNAAKEHSLGELLYGKSTGPTFRELWKKGKKRDG